MSNLLSALAGFLFSIRLPVFLRVPVIFTYCFLTGANKNEAEKELVEYSSVTEFFTRKLRAGLRQISDGVITPVDGRLLSEDRIITEGSFLVKGHHYQLSQLLGDVELAEEFKGGYGYTFYLSPADYHRVHAPCSGEISTSIHITGSLLPVGDIGNRLFPGVLSRNERVVTILNAGDCKVALVMVGATNVGSIKLAYDSFNTNQLGARFTKDFEQRPQRRDYQPSIGIERGQELGTFCLGSSVVLLISARDYRPVQFEENCRVRYGESLGNCAVFQNEEKLCPA